MNTIVVGGQSPEEYIQGMDPRALGHMALTAMQDEELIRDIYFGVPEQFCLDLGNAIKGDKNKAAICKLIHDGMTMGEALNQFMIAYYTHVLEQYDRVVVVDDVKEKN